MNRLAISLLFALQASATIVHAEPTVPELASIENPARKSQPRTKQPGDVSYRTMWRMQARVSALLPHPGELLTPVMRLALSEQPERERIEFLPAPWGFVIVGKTVDAVLPIRRGGYFELPAIAQAQARSEDAVVRFNVPSQKKWFEIGWHLQKPADGVMPYGRISQAFEELRQVQKEMAWWDFMMLDEKRARFDAVRACFEERDGKVLVAGAAAGVSVSAHCALLPYDPALASANVPVSFVGKLGSLTLDKLENYPELARR